MSCPAINASRSSNGYRGFFRYAGSKSSLAIHTKVILGGSPSPSPTDPQFARERHHAAVGSESLRDEPDNSPIPQRRSRSHRSRRRDHRRNTRDRAREEHNTDTNSSSRGSPAARCGVSASVPRERLPVLRSIPMRTKRARLLPTWIHHPRQRVVRALQSVPERSAAKIRWRRSVHASSLVSIHVGRTRRLEAPLRARPIVSHARDRPRWTRARRERRIRRVACARASRSVAAATPPSRDGATRPPSRRRARRRIVATRLDRPPSRASAGGTRG